MLLQLIYACFSSFWRRWFGGYNIGGDSKENAFYNQRWFRYMIGILITIPFFYLKEYNWLQICLATSVLYFLYWARAHGEFFDYGHSNPPNVARYEKEWWWKYIKSIIPEQYLYQWHCDFICMAIRYTLPSILLSIILVSYPLLFAGILLSCGYGLMWVLYDWGYIKSPTSYGELIGGFITGLLL